MPSIAGCRSSSLPDRGRPAAVRVKRRRRRFGHLAVPPRSPATAGLLSSVTHGSSDTEHVREPHAPYLCAREHLHINAQPQFYEGQAPFPAPASSNSAEGDDRAGRPSPNRRARHRFGSTVRWAVTGSNRRPPACKAGALPAELTAREGHGRTSSAPAILLGWHAQRPPSRAAAQASYIGEWRLS
jgi:hypothetical protein